jgi:hypothetical protein
MRTIRDEDERGSTSPSDIWCNGRADDSTDPASKYSSNARRIHTDRGRGRCGVSGSALEQDAAVTVAAFARADADSAAVAVVEVVAAVTVVADAAAEEEVKVEEEEGDS